MRRGRRTVGSHDLAEVVDADGFRESGAGKVQRRVIVSSAKEAVSSRSSVLVTAYDLADIVDSGSSCVDRTRNIQAHVASVAEQEAMRRKTWIDLIEPSNLTCDVDTVGTGINRSGHIERGVVAAATKEAAISGGRIKVKPYDLPGII